MDIEHIDLLVSKSKKNEDKYTVLHYIKNLIELQLLRYSDDSIIILSVNYCFGKPGWKHIIYIS